MPHYATPIPRSSPLSLGKPGAVCNHSGVGETRGSALKKRLDAIGITLVEFAERAVTDRGTISRAIDDDPSVRATTWSRLEKAVADAEDELGMAVGGNLVTSTVVIGDATITFSGPPDEVAEAIRKLLGSE